MSSLCVRVLSHTWISGSPLSGGSAFGSGGWPFARSFAPRASPSAPAGGLPAAPSDSAFGPSLPGKSVSRRFLRAPGCSPVPGLRSGGLDDQSASGHTNTQMHTNSHIRTHAHYYTHAHTFDTRRARFPGDPAPPLCRLAGARGASAPRRYHFLGAPAPPFPQACLGSGAGRFPGHRRRPSGARGASSG